MTRKSISALSGTGGITIFMILVVLCLAVFGVLAVVSAQADWRLTAKSAEIAEAYYAVDSRGVQVLAELAASNQAGTVDFAGALKPWLLPEDEVAVTVQGEDLRLQASLVMDAMRALAIDVVLKADGNCEILAWQVTDTFDEAELEQTLPVWGG
ncbi:MAG: hypothetical protein Q4B48_03520 [Syntrophomonadaceae bacterium]|nr:hypothetical protein [Syntrophomonadaceae bacterium]